MSSVRVNESAAHVNESAARVNEPAVRVNEPAAHLSDDSSGKSDVNKKFNRIAGINDIDPSNIIIPRFTTNPWAQSSCNPDHSIRNM